MSQLVRSVSGPKCNHVKYLLGIGSIDSPSQGLVCVLIVTAASVSLSADAGFLV